AALCSLSLVGADTGGRPAGGVALEQRAELVQVVEILGRVDPHHRAAVGDRVDEPFGLEHQERLADRRAADAELARELLFLQAPAGLEPTLDDRLPGQLGRGDAGVLDERPAVVEHPGHGTTIQYAIWP